MSTTSVALARPCDGWTTEHKLHVRGNNCTPYGIQVYAKQQGMGRSTYSFGDLHLAVVAQILGLAMPSGSHDCISGSCGLQCPIIPRKHKKRHGLSRIGH
jgi:hypothetical protein